MELKPGTRDPATRRGTPGASIGRRTSRRTVLLCSLAVILSSLGSTSLYMIGLARVEMNPMLYKPNVDWWFVLLIALPAAILEPVRSALNNISAETLLAVLVAVQGGLLGYGLILVVQALLWRSR